MDAIQSLSKVLIDDELSWWSNFEAATLMCPVCGFDYNHLGEPTKQPGNDNYKADWKGRGDLIVIPISAECGCEWEMCFGFHKGQVAASTRVTKTCGEA